MSEQQAEQKTESVFDDFTGKYSLSKTLRFELKPTPATQAMLEKNHVFETDQNLHNKYIAIKPYFDMLHREFIEASLADFSLPDLKKYLEIVTEYQKNKRDKKLEATLKKEELGLRREVVSQFNKTAKVWSAGRNYLKKNTVDMFFEAGIFAILKEKYGNDPNTMVVDETDEKRQRTISIFDQWGKFTGYFDKLHATRINLYKSDGTSTAIATRIIDQNLRRFVANIKVFQSLKQGNIDVSLVEKSFNASCDIFFSLDGYNKCLSQRGIDRYNEVLGGKTLANGERRQGLNELINAYRQKSTAKNNKLPFFTLLDKQILSERKENFMSNRGIQDAHQLLDILKNYEKSSNEKVTVLRNLFEQFSQKDNGYDFAKIYFSKEALNTILHRWVSNQEDVERKIFEIVKSRKSEYDLLKNGRKKASEIKEANGEFSFPDFIQVSHIQEALGNFSNEDLVWKSRYYKSGDNEGGCIEITDTDMRNQFLIIFQYEFQEALKKYDEYFPVFRQLVKKETLIDNAIDQNFKENVKNCLDTVKALYQMAKYFAVEKDRAWLDNYELCDVFYKETKNGFLRFYENAYAELVQGYDDVRNYLTKKPYSEEKWKLNFENATLADGWDKNKEKDNTAVILRKDGKYFLGVMAKGYNAIFDDSCKQKMTHDIQNGKYQKLVYKFTKDVVTGIPKSSTQVSEVIAHFRNSNEDFILKKSSSVGDFIRPLRITKEIFDLNNKIFLKTDISQFVYRWDLEDKEKEKDYVKLFQKDYPRLGGNLDIHKKAVTVWIDFCLEFLRSYPSSAFFDYSTLKTSAEYSSVDECYQEMNKFGYKVFFQDVSEDYVDGKNKEGELYLFQIKNKDWNLDKARNGKEKITSKNLHTLYFESLFSPENEAQNFPMKLNGQAEIFYRPKTAIEKLGMKKDSDGNDVVNHKRYSENKIFFHVPLTINRVESNANQYQFNQQTREFLTNNKEINIIGIDRGEKHLAYYSVINQNGEILDSGSLNNPSGKADYHKLLEEKAKSRKNARRDWSEVEKIKDLKRGYISQVVRKIADMIIEHNAIVVFEDLNMRFKQVRGGIEKSVYQQLEKQLIDKLSFLVNKDEINPNKAGHLLRAYQLTAPFETFKDMGKQTGIIFYTQAEYTSTTDPLTGFRKNVYISNSAKAEKIIDFVKSCDAIGWNETYQGYCFTYNPINFIATKDAKSREKTFSREWTVCAKVPRISGQKNKAGKWESKPLRPNDMLQSLLEGWGLTPKGERLQDIKSAILAHEKDLHGALKDALGNGKKRNFFADFIYIFNLILQIRNSFSKSPLKDTEGNLKRDEAGLVVYEGEDIDFIASPVYPFFTTKSSKSEANFGIFEKRFITEERAEKKRLLEEFNGDANGAYNIARKGIMILERLSDESALTKDGLYIHKHQWDEFSARTYMDTKK
jgi:hypothetical protein